MKHFFLIIALIFAIAARAESKHIGYVPGIGHDSHAVIDIPVDTISYSVSISARRQTIEGWGVSLCWWANMCGKWSDDKIDELLDWMVSPEGLNWNVFRYNIGGGDDPSWTSCKEHHMRYGQGVKAEMEGFQDERDGEFHWDRDAAQRKIMLRIREKRPDAIFEAFSNSAPWWMTKSGCCSGNKDANSDNLAPEYYTDFANYLVEVCKHYRDAYGIEFRTLEPFNEPNTDYWQCSGHQEGCHFDVSSQQAFIRVLSPILEKSGLNTTISASDETNVYLGLSEMRQFISDGEIDLIGQLNVHTYSADNRVRSQIGSLSRAAGKRIWQSETGSSGKGIGGDLTMAQRLIDDVRYMAPSAWLDWQYYEEGNSQWCTTRGSFSDATYQRVKNYYVRQQITRFLRQGYSVVESLNPQSLAAISPGNDTLVVVLNNNGNECYHRISLPMVKIGSDISSWRTSEKEELAKTSDFSVLNDNSICIHCPSLSITTLLIPVKDIRHKCREKDIAYLIVPQSSVSVAAASVDGCLKLASVDANDAAQRWHLVPKGHGTCQIRNEKGETVCFPGDYILKTTTSKVKDEKYTVECVDGIHHRIMLTGNMGWDLEGNNLSAGTTIGIYDYGSSADADTRNWFLMPVGQ